MLMCEVLMHIAVIGAGAVGGYYGAMLARSGQQVSFVARGAHLDAIRERGLRIESESVGSFTVTAAAESDAARIGPVDLVLFTVKTYDNGAALRQIPALLRDDTVVLTLQNGVDSAGEVASVAGETRTIAGATYIATAVEAPGLIRQTGSHRRIVFGECFGDAAAAASARVQAIAQVMTAADIHAEAVADARVPIWEKFVYLAPFAAFTGAARLPIGPIWEDADGRANFLAAVEEVEAVARASGVAIAVDLRQRIETYTATIPPTTRSSLLIDLSQGKRIEIESLAGSVVRRGAALGVPTPRMAALYAVLKPHASARS
jgi:2-dehydropantoate 2-reductase